MLRKLLILLPALYLVMRFCEKETDGFKLGNICSELTYNSAWDVAPHQLPQGIWKQNFTYLGAGGQCYAFVSDDGQYVLKLFKHHLRRSSFYFSQKKREKRQRKLERDFSSYKLAFETLPEETGLIGVHLNKTPEWKEKVTLIDKLHIAHTITLGDKEFIVQKRAELVHPYLTHLMENGEKEKAEKAIQTLLELIVARCQKGVFDEDARIHRNFGFIDGRAILIDVGRLKSDPQRKDREVYLRDLKNITRRFRVWLQENHPLLVEPLDHALNSL